MNLVKSNTICFVFLKGFHTPKPVCMCVFIHNVCELENLHAFEHVAKRLSLITKNYISVDKHMEIAGCEIDFGL